MIPVGCYRQFYASTHFMDGAGGIMFSVCPSVGACVRVEAFSDRLAVDFSSCGLFSNAV